MRRAPSHFACEDVGGLPPLSEDSLATAFSKQRGNDYLFDHHRGRWHRWTGNHWAQLETPVVFDLLRQLVRRLAHGSRRFCKSTFVAGAQRFAEADRRHAVCSESWNRNPWLLATPGGTVDLRTGRLRRASKADRITKMAGCSPMSGQPERWFQFLKEATNDDEEVVAYLQRVAGYALTGVTDEHAVFFIHGPGGNGKSVFLNILNYIMGDYAVTAPMETFTKNGFAGHPTELAMLDGARLVSAIETEAGRAWAEARLKSLTGGDRVSARFMRRDFFSYVPICKLVFVGNHQPTLADPDPAMVRRLHMIAFTHKPANPDLHLEDKLRREAPQILQWAIEGCLKWRKIGLARPAAIAQSTAEYFEQQDVFGQWLEERCEVSASGWEQPTPLYRDWCRFAHDAGEAEGSMVTFADRMKRFGLRPAKIGGMRGYRGIQLRTQGTGHEEI